MFANFTFSDGKRSMRILVGSNSNCEVLFGMNEKELYEIQEREEEDFKIYVHEFFFRMFKLKIKVSKDLYNNKV